MRLVSISQLLKNHNHLEAAVTQHLYITIVLGAHNPQGK